MKVLNFRLRPGQDVRFVLLEISKSHALQASAIISAVGSLSQAALRLAGAKDSRMFQGPFEIVSLSGTLSMDGLHVHLSLANHEGRVIGGHLLDGCIVHTTLELVLLEQNNIQFKRLLDPETGYRELSIES